MDSSSSLLVIAFHFEPSNEIGARRVSALCRYLTGRGMTITVLTAAEPAQTPQTGKLAVIRVPQGRRAVMDALVTLKRSLLRRPRNAGGDGYTLTDSKVSVSALTRLKRWYFHSLYFVDGHKSWAWRATRVAASRPSPPDVLLGTGPPHSTLLATALLGRLLRRPYVLDLRDPWTDFADMEHRRLEHWLSRRLERWTVKRAAAIVCTTESLAALLKERYPDVQNRIHVIRNGYDGRVHAPLLDTRGRLRMLYAGDLYFGRDPFPLLEAVEWLLQQPEVDARRFELRFVGNVTTYAGRSLSKWLEGKRAQSVVQIGTPLSAEALGTAMAEATVLVNLAQHQPFSVPAKTYEHLARRREMLLLCEDDCETARITRNIPGVHQVDPASFGALTRTLRMLYQRQVLQGFAQVPPLEVVERFSRELANGAFACLFQELICMTRGRQEI